MQDVVSGGVPPEANLEAGSLGQRVRCGADAGEAQREGGAGSGEDSPPAQAHQRAGGSAAPEAQPHGGPLRGCGITPWCRPTHAPGGLCVYPPVKLLHREGLLCTSCFLGQEKPASGRDWCLGGQAACVRRSTESQGHAAGHPWCLLCGTPPDRVPGQLAERGPEPGSSSLQHSVALTAVLRRLCREVRGACHHSGTLRAPVQAAREAGAWREGGGADP